MGKVVQIKNRFRKTININEPQSQFTQNNITAIKTQWLSIPGLPNLLTTMGHFCSRKAITGYMHFYQIKHQLIAKLFPQYQSISVLRAIWLLFLPYYKNLMSSFNDVASKRMLCFRWSSRSISAFHVQSRRNILVGIWKLKPPLRIAESNRKSPPQNNPKLLAWSVGRPYFVLHLYSSAKSCSTYAKLPPLQVKEIKGNAQKCNHPRKNST